MLTQLIILTNDYETINEMNNSYNTNNQIPTQTRLTNLIQLYQVTSKLTIGIVTPLKIK